MLEGIMMKNKEQYSVAVRKPDGEIEVYKNEHAGIAGSHAWAKFYRFPGSWHGDADVFRQFL